MSVWYRDGLCFECTQCGRCCGGSPGVVWVDREEIRRMAGFLNEPVDALWGRFIRRIMLSRVSLIERPNGDCVFLRCGDDGRRSCSLYTLRPQQCRTWPFWTSNLTSRSTWDHLRTGCPGINRGRVYSFEQIEAIRTAPPWYGQPEDQRHEVRQ